MRNSRALNSVRNPASKSALRQTLTIIMTLLVCLLSVPAYSAQTPGSLDLRQYEWGQGLVYHLDGDWIWAPQQWLTNDELDELPLSERSYTQVPGFWNETEKDFPAFGYGTLAIRLYLPKGETFHLQLSDIGSAYKLFSNGQQLTQVGSPSTFAEHAESMFRPRLAELRSIGQPIWLILHISNHEYKQIGVRRSIHITDESGYHWLRETPLLFEMFFCGVLLTLGCLAIARYLRKRNELASLYLGLFSMMVGTRALLVGERFIYQLEWFSFATLQKVEHVLVYAGFAAFGAYLYELMDGGMSRRAREVLWMLPLALIGLTVFLPLHIGTLTVIPFKLLVVAAALYVIFAYWPLLRARGAGVFWFAASFAALLSTLLIDLVNQNTQLQSRPIVHWGMITFVVCQGLFLNQVRHWRKRRLVTIQTSDQASDLASDQASNQRSQSSEFDEPITVNNELNESHRKIELLELQMQQLRSDLLARRADASPSTMLKAGVAMSEGTSGHSSGSASLSAHSAVEDRSAVVESYTEQRRIALVKLLQTTLSLWERYSGKTKVQLAEESQCWRVYIDGTTVKTRTFDKYLQLHSLPSKPRWRLVIRTAYFVLEKGKLPEAEQALMSEQIQEVQAFFE
jgi:7TM diverse intracellular signalling